MSEQVFLEYLRSFTLGLDQKTVETMTKLLDPFNFKYKRPFNILSPEDNPQEYHTKTILLTHRVMQLSLVKLCVDLKDEKNSKTYTYGSYCEFLAEHLKEIIMVTKAEKVQSGMMRMVMYLLWKMGKQWSVRGYNVEVKRNKVELERIIVLLKEFLEDYVNKEYIKNDTDKLGLYSLTRNTPLMTSSQTIPSSLLSIQPQQTSPTQLFIQFTTHRTSSQLYLSVYSILIFLYYYNDQSSISSYKIIKDGINSSNSPKKSQVYTSMITEHLGGESPKIYHQQEDEFSQQSIYFSRQHFLSLLSQSLQVLFYLSTGGKQLSMMTQMFILCSHIFVFKSNQQKPTILRLVLYNQKKLTNKLSWQHIIILKQQQQRYIKLMSNYLMLDPKFRLKLLELIDQWLEMGIELMNLWLMTHWNVLIDIVNKRIFENLLQGEMFNLLISKSQGNKHCRNQVSSLLSEMISHISIEIIIKNSQQIFCLQEFLQKKRVKLLEIYFQYIKRVLDKKTSIGNKTMVNRVVGLYLQMKQETRIQKGDFVDFFRKVVVNSVESGEKLFTEKILKFIHAPQQQAINWLLNSQQQFNNFRKLSSEIDTTSQGNKPQSPFIPPTLSSSQQFPKPSKSRFLPTSLQKIVVNELNQQSEQVQTMMLRQLLQQRKKGESYFLKFMKDINKSFFTENSIIVFEIYAEYLLSKMTDYPLQLLKAIESNNKVVQLISNPQAFQRYSALYESLFAVVNERKIVSLKLYQSMLILEALKEREKLSERYHWFVRKLKYFFAQTPIQQMQSYRSYNFSELSSPEISLNYSQKIPIQAINPQNQPTENLILTFFDSIKSIFFKLKNKITFVSLMTMFCLRYCQTHRKVSNIERKQHLDNRNCPIDNELALQLSEIYDFLSTNNYALILSTCSISTSILMILYNLVLMNQYMLHSGIKGAVLQSGVKIRQLEQVDFTEVDNNVLLVEIRKILVLMMDSFTPYQVDEFLYMFTMKQSSGEKLLTYMGLPSFESIPLIARLQPIIKIIKQITIRKYPSLQKKQIILPFYNHIEFTFIPTTSSQFTIFKRQQKALTISLQMLINWSIKCDNFISFWTDKGKYKLIIRQYELALFFRKDGSNRTQTIRVFDVKPGMKERVSMEIIVKSKDMNVYLDRKKLVASIACDSQVEGIKLDMINGMLIEQMSVTKTTPQIDFQQNHQLTSIYFKKSFTKLTQLQIQLKLKQLSHIHHQSTYMTFPYAKYFFLLKQLIKNNKQLCQHSQFQLLFNQINQTYLKMLQNKTITISSFITTNNRLLNGSSMNTNSSFGQNKKDAEGLTIINIKPEDIWKRLAKVMVDAFVENKHHPREKQRRKTQRFTRIQRKFSYDTTLLRLQRNFSTKSRPQSQDDELMCGKGSAQSIQIGIFIDIPKLPDLSNKSSKIIYSKGFVYYLLGTILQKEMWQYYSQKDKLQISLFIKGLCGNKQFLTQVQNDTFDIFYHLLLVYEKVTEHESTIPSYLNESKSVLISTQQPLSPLSTTSQYGLTLKNLSQSIKEMILSHQLNEMLRTKFKYMFYMGQTGKSIMLKQLFLQIADKLSCRLLMSNSSSTSAKMSQWLLINSQHFEYIFSTCRQQTRVRILDYLSQTYDQNQQNSLMTFMDKLSIEMIYQVRMWIMIFAKKLLFKLKMKQNVLKLMTQLGEVVELLLKVADQIKDKAEKQVNDKIEKQIQKDQLLRIVQQTIFYLYNRQQLNQPISKQLQYILTNDNFIRYFQLLIQQNVLIPTVNTNCQNTKLCSVIFKAIFNLEKQFLLKALTTYRRLANKVIPLLIYPLKLVDVTRKLSIYQLSCFLQYILEVTLSVENSIGTEEKSYFVISVKTYLQWLVKNYQSRKQQVPGALVYVYPKLYHMLNCHSKKQLQTKIKKVRNIDFMELRGGVYFKLIVIIVHLIQMKPDEDLSMLVEVILFKPLDQKDIKDQRELSAAFRVMNDFSQQSLSRQRSFIQKLMNQFSHSHKLYSSEHDKPLIPLEVISNKLVKFEQENDLTTYCVDFMLMRLVQYLSESSNKSIDPIVETVNKKYSNLVTKALQKFPLIYNDLSQKNVDSNITVHDYPSLLELICHCQENLGTEKLNSPLSKNYFDPECSSTPSKDYIDEAFFEQIHTKSPPKSVKIIELYQNQRFTKTAGKRDQSLNGASQRQEKKRSVTYFIGNQITKAKDAIFSLAKKDHKQWSIEIRKKKFSRFFRDEAKELLIIEFIFTYYVENTTLKSSMSTISQKEARVIQKYFHTIEEWIQKYEKDLQKSQCPSKHLIRIFDIKRLCPYFLQNIPILKVKAYGFPNMCMPIMTQMPKPSYRLKQLDQQQAQSNIRSFLFEDQQFRVDMFGIDNHSPQRLNNSILELQEIYEIKGDLDGNDQLDLSCNIAMTPKKISDEERSQSSPRHKSYICLQQSDDTEMIKSKRLQSTYCQLVTRKGVYFCQWRIQLKENGKMPDRKQYIKTKSQPILIFKTHKHKPKQCPRYMKYGSPISNLLSVEKQIQISLKLIREIFFRKYNQIRNNSIELFCSDGRQHFICLYSLDRAEGLVHAIFENTKTITNIKIIRNPENQFETKEYTNKWMNGEMDNFTYLMMVNKYSGRSFCDTNQYPVFPWVVSDYVSEELNFSDIKTYRDLTKPIGALNELKLEKYYEKYHLQNQDTGFFLYGSHFSTSLFVYYFLVRMEPFSSLHQQMQGGSWDAPDRLFSSIKHMWESLVSPSSATDIKESIPEFYYFPFFLKNINHIDLGTRQSGEPVNDVRLPPWANKSPQNFVHQMRLALESNYVSLYLPAWIDLIFGLDQKNIKRHNLFHPLSYSENIHIQKIPQRDLEARICQISYFGQFPTKLFTKQHRMKKLSINKIFSRDIIVSGFMKSNILPKKQAQESFTLILPPQFSIKSISKKSKSQNSSSCILKVKNIQLNIEIEVEIDPKVQGVENIMRKLTSYSRDFEKSNKKQKQSINSKDKQQASTKTYFDPFYLGYSQPRTCTIMSRLTPNILTFYSASNPNIVLTSHWFESRFSSHLYNQSFVILYGEDGLSILNWNFEQIFSYSKRAIDSCYVDELLVFVASKDGRLYVYDLAAKNMTRIADLALLEEEMKKKERESKTQKQMKGEKEKQKQQQTKIQKLYSTKMKVFYDKKLISMSNEEQYKIILVGNDNKIFIVNYKHLKKNWVNIEKI